MHRIPAFAVTVVLGVGLVPCLAVPLAAAAPRAAVAVVTAGTLQVSSSTVQATSSVVGIAGWPDGLGYWVARATGAVVAGGGARYYGSLAGRHLNAPVVGIAATPTGRGYWLVEANGGVYGFGTAHFYGSMAGHHLVSPFVGMATTPDGGGYWLVAADGGVFSFGDAHFWGSVPGNKVKITHAIGLFPTHTGAGYYVETPSARYAFGDVYPDVPTGAKHPPASPVVSAAAMFRGLCEVNAKGTVVVYRTVAVYHASAVWSEQLVMPRPVAVASTAVSRNLFVLDALGQVKEIAGPGPVPVT